MSDPAMTDRAELARLCGEANSATTMWHADKALRAIEQICSPDYLLALLAEIAALRGERDAAIERWEGADGMDGAVVHAIRQVLIAAKVPTLAFIDDHVSLLVAQRTEAERKLAEAVGLLSELEQHVRAASEGRGHARAGVKSADAARTFLASMEPKT